MASKFTNQTYANLGSTKATFDDNTTETKNINSLGTTVFGAASPSNKQVVQLEMLGQVFVLDDLPSQITYPNSTTGTVSAGVFVTDLEWFADEQTL